MPAKKKDLLLGPGSGGGKGLLKKGSPAKKAAAKPAWSSVVTMAKALGIKLTAPQAKKVVAGQPVTAKKNGQSVTVSLMDKKAPTKGLTIEEDLFADDQGADFHSDIDLVISRLVFLGFHDADPAMAEAILGGEDIELTDKKGDDYLVGRYDSSLHIRATNLGDGPDACSDPDEATDPGTKPAGPELTPVKATRGYQEGEIVFDDEHGTIYAAAEPINLGDLIYAVGKGEDGGIGKHFRAASCLRMVTLSALEATKDFSLGEKVLDADDGSGAWFANRNIPKGDRVGYWTQDGALAPATSIEFRDTMAEDVKKSVEADLKKAPADPPKKDAKSAADALDGEVKGHLNALRQARNIEKRIRGLDADLEKARKKVKEIKDAIDDAEEELHRTVRQADPGPLFDRRPKCGRCGDRSGALNAGPVGTAYVDKHVCPDCSRVLREELEATGRAKKASKAAAKAEPPDDAPTPPSDDQAGSQAGPCEFCKAGDIPATKPGADADALYHETADGWIPCAPTQTDAPADDEVDRGQRLDALTFTRQTVRAKFEEVLAKHGAAKVDGHLWPSGDILEGFALSKKMTVGDVKDLVKALAG